MTKMNKAFLPFFLFLNSPFFLLNITFADTSPGFHNESEAGIILTGGNTHNENYNLSQLNNYKWGTNSASFNARYLKGFSNKQETARYWTLGLRFDRDVNSWLGYYAGYKLESDIFAGYDPRHNVDGGGKFTLIKTETYSLLSELGYRFIHENQLSRGPKDFHLGRGFLQGEYLWTPTFSSRLWFEFLHNFTDSKDYMFNTEASSQAVLNAVFSVKLAYLVRYRNVPAAATAVPADRMFTTSLIAKF